MSKKIDIISLYLGNYARCIAGREIARLIKLNHQTALNHLNELVKEKVLEFNPGVEIIQPKISSAYGAALLAKEL